MNWYNKIKKEALDWNYDQEPAQQPVSPPASPQGASPSLVNENENYGDTIKRAIENAVEANEVNIYKFFKQKYPQGIQIASDDLGEILMELKPDINKITDKLISQDKELSSSSNQLTRIFLSDSVLNIAIKAVGLGDLFGEIDV